ncbi:MAG: undecaprenyl-diphosphatase UppP [Patescibacteria group bacterium]|jgi:undecaprenyl-diphosphatase
MEILYSILAGIIQGLTEFLPISSSGHLVLFHDFLSFDFPDNLAFDVVLHLGTLVALLLFFRFDVINYLLAWFQSFSRWELKSNNNQRLAWYLFLATLPAAVIGYFLGDQIEILFRQPGVVALMLIIFGIILYLADKFFVQLRTITELNLGSSLVIGLFQALALIPGVSRSGITIIAGLSQKLKRQDAARFGFLLSLPVIFGAGLKEFLSLLSDNLLVGADFFILILGFLVSAVTGYLCIKYFLKFLENHSLKVFAYYRIVLGAVILVMLYFNKF